MKTVRTNTFETNSSSTHAFSLNSTKNLHSLKPSQTFIPDEDGEIKVDIEIGEADNSMNYKLRFLLNTSYIFGDQAAFDRVVSTVEKFTRAKLRVQSTNYIYERNCKDTVDVLLVKQYKNDEEREEAISDEFYPWTRDQDGDSTDFVNSTLDILSSEQSIGAFIFSNFDAFSTETYYD